MTSPSAEAEPAPVFVDQTGQRGRRLRGLGWLVGIVCTGFVVAMASGLVGTQSQAPALPVPGTADTTPPSQYLNAPLPAAPGVATGTATSTATSTASADATASVSAPTTAGASTSDPATGTSASDPAAGTTGTPGATASEPATTAAGTTPASASVTDTAQ